MFVREQRVVVPELLDMVLAYLTTYDLYTCLFVNRQLHSHATPLLYRNITLYLHPDSAVKNMTFNNPNLRTIKVGNRVAAHPELYTYVREMTLFLNNPIYGDSATDDHLASMLSIIQQNGRLQKIFLYDPYSARHDFPKRPTEAIVNEICNLLNYEELELSIESLGCAHKEYLVSLLLTSKINECIVSLTPPVFRHSDFLNFLGTCKKLRRLDLLRNDPWNRYILTDFAEVCKNVPLQEIRIALGFRSLPSTLRRLYYHLLNEASYTDIQRASWEAICSLENLELLHIWGKLSQWPDQDILPQFRSAKLKSLTINIDEGSGNLNVWHKMVRPILNECRGLEYIKIKQMNGTLRFLSLIFDSQPNLVTLLLYPKLECDYGVSFDTIIRGAQNTRRLRKLSFPLSLSNEKLWFRQCRSLANSCPNLNTVEIQFLEKQRLQRCLQFRAPGEWWTSLSSEGRDTLEEYRYDDSDIPNQSIEHVYDLSVFVPERSPCLDVCTKLRVPDVTLTNATYLSCYFLVYLSLLRFRDHLTRCREDDCSLKDDEEILKDWSDWVKDDSDKYYA